MRRLSTAKRTMAVVIVAFVASACGTTVLTRKIEPIAAQTTELNKGLSEGTQEAVNLAQGAPKLLEGAGDPKCATNSNPSQGFTDSTVKWGTIIPLNGALRPLGEQTARVMRVAVNYLNSITSVPGGFDWGCSSRPGIYGRTVSLTVLSLNQNTQDEANLAMRRLIDVEKVFLVRDCYLESNLMGPATDYQNDKKVPALWCFHSEMPYPSLAPYNWSPGTDPMRVVAIHTGWLLNELHRSRLAILHDPSVRNNLVVVVKKVYKHITGQDIPSGCIVETKAQDAPGGMSTQIEKIRRCYPGGQSPDAVITLDALNGIFGALAADHAGWSLQSSGVAWACATCWVQTLADVCGSACTGMITDCQALPCIPWSDLPAAQTLEGVRSRYLPQEPKDVLTYGPLAITLGIGLWMGMTGPDLSREKLVYTVGHLTNWDAGIGPILTTNAKDHFGGKAIWLIRFDGTSFSDYTHGFKTLGDVHVPDSLTSN